MINLGNRGNDVAAVLLRIDRVNSLHPKTVFLMAGVNDVLQGRSADQTAKTYADIIERIRKGSPQTIIYIESILPVTDQVPFTHRLVKGRTKN